MNCFAIRDRRADAESDTQEPDFWGIRVIPAGFAEDDERKIDVMELSVTADLVRDRDAAIHNGQNDALLNAMRLDALETWQAEMGARMAALEGIVFALQQRLIEFECHLRQAGAVRAASDSTRMPVKGYGMAADDRRSPMAGSPATI
ncbi:MAG TPA: hypothetical protein VKU82_10410 [Planctomycetaceae bacterium]|nr:hypothetical protein [Planctomycetaceae bacterium]